MGNATRRKHRRPKQDRLRRGRARERRERVCELGRARKALIGLPLQTAEHDLLELRMNLGVLTERRRIGLQNRRKELAEVVAHEREVPRHQLVEDDADRPNVRAVVDALRRAKLLRRHVERRAEHGLRRRESARAGRESARSLRLRDAEVEDLHHHRPVLAFCEEQVRWLQIAMDDPDRVRLRDPAQRLKHIMDRDVGSETMARLAFEHLREVLAVEQLEDHVRIAHLLIDVVDADHVLVLDVRGGATFVDEALSGFRIARVGEHDLDRDGFRKLQVARSEDRAHAALSDQMIEHVLAGDHVPRPRQLGRGRGGGHADISIGVNAAAHKLGS
jgi:hypothetical protein